MTRKMGKGKRSYCCVLDTIAILEIPGYMKAPICVLVWTSKHGVLLPGFFLGVALFVYN